VTGADEQERPETAERAEAAERALAEERERARRERARLETELERLRTALAERTSALARARATLDVLRSDPIVRLYLRGRRAGGRAAAAGAAGARRVSERGRRNPGPADGAEDDRAPPSAQPPRSRIPLAALIEAMPERMASPTRKPTIVWTDGDRSPAEAAAAIDAGSPVLLVSADLEPFKDEVAERLVATLEAVDAGLVGPALLETATVRVGLAFELSGGWPVAVSRRASLDDVYSRAGPFEVPAVPTPGLLVRGDLFASLVDVPALDWPGVGIELSLRSRAGGRPAAVDPSVPLPVGANEVPAPDLAPIVGRWGPSLLREILLDRLSGGGRWSDRPATAVVLGAAGATGDQLSPEPASVGWHLVEAGDDPDVAIVASPAVAIEAVPRHAIRVGWIAGDVDAWLASPWADELDLAAVTDPAFGPALDRRFAAPVVVVGDTVALRAAIVERAGRPAVAIHTGPADRAAAPTWGDTPFAIALRRQLERHGLAATVLVHAEADGPIARRADVTLQLAGTRELPLGPGQLNVMWVISHPDELTARRCERFDLVFVASTPFRDHIAGLVSRPVVALHQATDPDRFFPEAGGPSHELLFVGNSRNRRRPVLDMLADTAHDLAVYGTNWRPDLLDPRRLRGTWIRNDELHRAYSAAAIVLNDHWPDMRDEGFFSNRLYDALASGAFVLTDRVPGIEAEFDDGVATYEGRDELLAAVERYLADPDARHVVAERGRQAVHERHTFAHRVATIREHLDPLLASRPLRIEEVRRVRGQPVGARSS
jgi:hypothetical protein